jgi:hypothetical protein
MSGKTFFLQLNALQHLLNSIYQKTHEKHYFTVDNGLIYEMIYKDRVTRRNVYNMNLERINKHDTIKHYIQARGKYIRTSINEYSKDSQTIIPIEKKLKNYIVVYNFSDGNHYALQLEVYSRETGKCVLKLSSHIVPKNSQDPERIGVKYIEKDQIVQEVIYNEEKRTVTVNIYDLSSIPIKKKSYNLKFKSSGNLAVFYLDNEDGAYIRYIDDLYNSMVLYKLDGTSLNEIHLKKIPSNTLLPGEKERFFDNNILSYYNPDSNKTEYLMSAVKNTDEGIGLLKLFITDGFPLHMIKGSFDTLIVYKEYFLTVSKENKRKKAFIFHLYKGNRKLLSFKRKNIKFNLINLDVGKFSNKIEKINEINNISVGNPTGAFYLFVDVSHYCNGNYEGINSSIDFCNWLLDKYFIAFVPGEVFGAHGYMRLSYALSDDELSEGLERLNKAVEELNG